jgi:predicted nucleotidyltransferase
MTYKTANPGTIEEEISWMEGHFDVEVMLAVEYGSRLWNLAGPASDHDIRFVYKDKPERAFSLFDKRETLSHNCELPTDDGKIEVEFSGWSLEKALRLCVASNPQTQEINAAPVVFEANHDFQKDLSEICADASPRTMAHYYRGNAKKNLLGHICKIRGADVKINLQMVRGFMSSMWLIQNPGLGKFPPLDFSELRESVDLSISRMPIKGFNKELDELVQLKTETSSRRVNRFFTLVEQWGLGVMDSIEEDIMKIPDHRTDSEIAEKSFRRQYPNTFPDQFRTVIPGL